MACRAFSLTMRVIFNVERQTFALLIPSISHHVNVLDAPVDLERLSQFFFGHGFGKKDEQSAEGWIINVGGFVERGGSFVR